MQIIDRHSIKLRVSRARFGRNPGLWHRCLCGGGGRHPPRPARLAGARYHRGGDLNIAWGGAGRPVLMTGPAVTVFTGEIEL